MILEERQESWGSLLLFAQKKERQEQWQGEEFDWLKIHTKTKTKKIKRDRFEDVENLRNE